MKTRLLFLLLFLLLTSLTINTEVNADSIGVSPGKLIFDDINNLNNEFIIYNPNNNNFNFDIYSEPLDWIRFTPQSGTIEPRGKIEITAQLTVPEKTKTGKYETFIYVNNNKNNNNTTLIKTGAAIKTEITIKQGINSSFLMGLMIILTIIILGVLAYKKTDIFR
jgi:hypothetical protein